jgi:hypothetical protein
MLTKYWLGNPKERYHLGDLDIHGSVVFKMDLKEIRCDGVNWIQLAQDKVQWLNLVNTVTNLRVP